MRSGPALVVNDLQSQEGSTVRIALVHVRLVEKIVIVGLFCCFSHLQMIIIVPTHSPLTWTLIYSVLRGADPSLLVCRIAGDLDHDVLSVVPMTAKRVVLFKIVRIHVSAPARVAQPARADLIQ